MKVIEIMNMNRILSNGEMKVFKKIKKKGVIENKDLSERENYIAKQLLQKGIIDYKMLNGKLFYCFHHKQKNQSDIFNEFFSEIFNSFS